jgi:hypothetical protein
MNANEIRINPALVYTPLCLAGVLHSLNALFSGTAIAWIKGAAWVLMLVVLGIMAHLMFKMHRWMASKLDEAQQTLQETPHDDRA